MASRSLTVMDSNQTLHFPFHVLAALDFIQDWMSTRGQLHSRTLLSVFPCSHTSELNVKRLNFKGKLSFLGYFMSKYFSWVLMFASMVFELVSYILSGGVPGIGIVSR